MLTMFFANMQRSTADRAEQVTDKSNNARAGTPQEHLGKILSRNCFASNLTARREGDSHHDTEMAARSAEQGARALPCPSTRPRHPRARLTHRLAP